MLITLEKDAVEWLCVRNNLSNNGQTIVDGLIKQLHINEPRQASSAKHHGGLC